VASRAHHADVGGTFPGSMGPCSEIYQEGFRSAVKIMRGGKLVPDVLALLLNNVRTGRARRHLGAQIAAARPARSGFAILQPLRDARVNAAAGELLSIPKDDGGFFATSPGTYRRRLSG